jgi:predicted CoA-binding protein
MAVPDGSAEAIGRLLRSSRSIAVVGASPEPWRPSFGISRALKSAGYRMIPVNPNHAGSTLHGEPVLASLAAIGEPVDLVNVFRRSDAIGEVVEDAIRAGAPAIWLQLGIRNDPAVARAREAGLEVVQNRCISVELARLRG